MILMTDWAYHRQYNMLVFLAINFLKVATTLVDLEFIERISHLSQTLPEPVRL